MIINRSEPRGHSALALSNQSNPKGHDVPNSKQLLIDQSPKAIVTLLQTTIDQLESQGHGDPRSK